MAWNQWPYYPNSLSEVFQTDEGNGLEHQIPFLLSGASDYILRALTVLEPIIREDGTIERDALGEVEFKRIDAFGKHKNFIDLCIYLRGEDGLGKDDICLSEDFSIAKKVWKGIYDELEFHLCRPLGLEDTADLVRVVDRKVAVLFSGQFLQESDNLQEAIEKVKERFIDKCDCPFDEGKLQKCLKGLITRSQYLEEIQQLRNKERELRQNLLDKPNVESIVREAAETIGGIAESHYKQRKAQKENEFHNDLFPADETNIRTREEFVGRVKQWIERIRNFCSAEYVILYVKNDPYVSYTDTIGPLNVLIKAGIPEDEKLPAFNWSETRLGFRDAHLPRINNDAVELLKSGFGDSYRGHRGLFRSARFILPMEMGGTYFGLIVIGPMTGMERNDTARERDFLKMACHRILLRTLMDLQILDFVGKVDKLNTASRLLRHRFRGILTPVSGGVRIIDRYINYGLYSEKQAKAASKRLQDFVERMREEIGINIEMITDDREGIYKFSTCNLGEIIQASLSEHFEFLREKSISTPMKLESGLVLEADKPKLVLAISNVLHNAIKYSHAGKRVNINAWSDGDEIILEIIDFGLGIDQTDLPHVFDKGFQGLRSDKARLEPGEGLGLWQSRLIVRAHGGNISVTQKSGERSDLSYDLEGYQVTFLIELPVEHRSIRS